MTDTSDPITRVTSSHWGAFQVVTQGNRIIATHPFADDPDPSAIPDAVPQAVHHRSRVARPAIRRGWLKRRDRSGRGNDDFVDLPWDEALDIAAAEIDRIRQTHGNQAIYGGSYGWSSAGRFHHGQSQVHRFLNVLGGYVASFGSYSTGCAQAIMPHVFGVNFLSQLYRSQDSWQTLHDHTDLLVMFGGINPKNAQVSMGGITEHGTKGWFERFHAKGMACLNIGPQRSDAPAGCDWLPCIPGSDTALMLALAYELETQGLTDHDFLARYTTGWAQFRPYLMGDSDGQPKTADWASPLCGVAPDAIRDLARRMAQGRTLITVAWSLQRAEHGEQPFWMAAVLAAMLGQIGLPGGGVGYGYGAIGGVGKPMRPIGGATLDQGQNPVDLVIPVARVADMLLHPGAPYEYNGKHLTYPDIRLVYWAGGNPFHHHQDLGRLNRAFQQPETIIVNEPWWTATAQRADIVFPATTPYEREDLGLSPMDDYLFHMPQLIPPVDEARNDYDIFAGLADRLGAKSDFTQNRTADSWLREMYATYRSQAGAAGVDLPDYEGLKTRNWIKMPIASDTAADPFLTRFRTDPQAHALPTPSGRIEIFSKTIDSFGYDDCPGHPVWLPPQEWLGAATPATPLHLTSPQPGDKLHSQLECALADQPGARPETLIMHPADAATRGLRDGDLVRVHNSRGAVRARLHISDAIREQVVALPTGAWYGPSDAAIDPDGNPNVLTRDVGTSRLGQGCSAHSTLVQVTALSHTG